MTALKVRKVGNSLGLVLPVELLTKLHVKEGDILHAVDTPNGVKLTAYDPAVAQQLEVARRVMREDRDALRALAKE